VLSAEELSLIAGMPTAVGQLPVETGTSRVTRRQFAFGKPITGGKPTEEGKAEKPEKAESKAEGKVESEGKVEEAKVELKEAVLEAFLSRPLKVEGVLSDPKTGAPIANVEYEVYEDGKRVFADATDEAGRFSFVFNADREGDVKLEVKARGYAEPVRRFDVRVKK
jgi:ribosomal protein L2